MERPTLYFNDLALGQTFPEFELNITEEVVKKYCRSVEDTNDYADPSGKKMVPLTIASLYSTASYKKFIENPHGTLHTKSEYEIIRPIYVGDTLRIQASVVDKYEKKGKNYVAFKTLAERDEEVVLISTTTLMWGK